MKGTIPVNEYELVWRLKMMTLEPEIVRRSVWTTKLKEAVPTT
jgi:hypothetical protein